MARRIRTDPAVEFYDPGADGYDLAKDPRCLYGPAHGEVRRMRWCPRCGELYSLSVVWCPECKGHNAVDVRLVLADVTVRAVGDE